MTPNSETVRARRYLLGDASEEERTAIEREYLEFDETVDRIAAAEDDLIEDYLGDQLSPVERERFERAYLSVPHRRVRVETVRRLMARSAPVAQAHPPQAVPGKTLPFRSSRRPPGLSWLMLAASVLLALSLFSWRMSSRGDGQQTVIVDQRPQAPAAQPVPSAPGSPVTAPQAPPPQAAPRVFAVTISPVSVRSAADAATVVVPARTDTVTLRLESDADPRALTPSRVSIRTVSGTTVWQGRVGSTAGSPRGTAARVDVPAQRLVADDYVVTLYGLDGGRVEQEWAQYFLRVRPR